MNCTYIVRTHPMPHNVIKNVYPDKKKNKYKLSLNNSIQNVVYISGHRTEYLFLFIEFAEKKRERERAPYRTRTLKRDLHCDAIQLTSLFTIFTTIHIYTSNIIS